MQTTIKENDFFRLILSKTECLKPEGLFNIKLTQEIIKDGEFSKQSTYQFFMTQQDLNKLKENL
jgi:hypothetical protein